MNTDPDLSLAGAGHTEAQTATPSVDFITAISEFFDTDPSDLLVELGYYSRDEDVSNLVD